MKAHIKIKLGIMWVRIALITYLTSTKVGIDSSRNRVYRVEKEAARIQQGKLKGESTDANQNILR